MVFSPGDIGPKSIVIDIIDDKIIEPTEAFTVLLSPISPTVSVGNPAFVNIIDNDGESTAGKMESI